MARVGLLGGTFNPPHLGHLVCAQEALLQVGLDRVLLVPLGVAPHKLVEADPGVAHRVAMCEAAVAGDERLGVSRADAERDGPSYTVDLLRGLGGEHELTFIVGGDMAYSLPDVARSGGRARARADRGGRARGSAPRRHLRAARGPGGSRPSGSASSTCRGSTSRAR